MYSSSNKNQIWSSLEEHRKEISKKSLFELFNENPNRGSDFSTSFEDLWVDISKQTVNSKTIQLLSDLAEESKINQFFVDMMAGSPVNSTEKKPALHTALRAPKDSKILVEGKNVVPKIAETLEKMEEFSHHIRNGKLLGATGVPITSVVALGIGGSNLGSSMAHEALSKFTHSEITIKFCSSIDAVDLDRTLDGLNPETTIFLVTSKSFNTRETLLLMENAKEWLKGAMVATGLPKHFVGITSSRDKAINSGLEESMVFDLPDWVGGRFSLSSAAGLVLMISIGPDEFFHLLSGMNRIDNKTVSESFESNGTLLLALTDIWNRSFLDYPTMAVIPYSSQMSNFPPYLQQLMMESLGKNNRNDEHGLGSSVGSVIWGATGTESQHAFFQFLHQGTDVVPCEMLGFSSSYDDSHQEQQNSLFANLLAQSETLAFGSDIEEEDLMREKKLEGNRPSTVILTPKLTPFILGQLISLYEHRTVASGVIWGVNPFDQWGVELGKNVATDIELEMSSTSSSKKTVTRDSSTEKLLERFKIFRDL
jgi:glucose-6-phosphate isomerase